MRTERPFCNCHGCTNPADVVHFHKVFTNDDGGTKWDVFVNSCEHHFDDLILQHNPKKRKFKKKV